MCWNFCPYWAHFLGYRKRSFSPNSCRTTRKRTKFTISPMSKLNLRGWPFNQWTTFDVRLANHRAQPLLRHSLTSFPYIAEQDGFLISGLKGHPRNHTKEKPWLKFFKSRSTFKVKVTRSKITEPRERSCRKSTNQLWNEFRSTIESGIQRFVPFKHYGNRKSLPLITQEIKRYIRRRDSLYQKQKRSRQQKDRSDFLKANHKVNASEAASREPITHI